MATEETEYKSLESLDWRKYLRDPHMVQLDEVKEYLNLKMLGMTTEDFRVLWMMRTPQTLNLPLKTEEVSPSSSSALFIILLQLATLVFLIWSRK